MKKKKLTFAKVYLVYLILVAVFVVAAIVYVNRTIHQYEDLRPEKCVQKVIDELAADAADGSFWDKYFLQNVSAGEYEKDIDIKGKYLELYEGDEVEFVQKNIEHAEDELYYSIQNGSVVLAEVKLKAKGPAVTKLTVLNIREWEVEHIKPQMDTYDYSISLPADFSVNANGIALSEQNGVKNGDNEIIYTVKNVYLEPVFDIKDQDGNAVNYSVKNNQVIAEFYNYTLTLPATLTVELNGNVYQGQAVGDDRIRYDIRTLEKPQVMISDSFGNKVEYNGEEEFPLTHMMITADSSYQVNVMGKNVPEEVVTVSANREYEQFSEYVEALPELCTYNIAVLQEDAEISVTDKYGNAVEFDKEQSELDLTIDKNTLAEVPDEVSGEIDVLNIAQNWSLFMSNDLPFSKIDDYLIKGSYQYDVAMQYATGEDITFTSEHVLKNPAFTENTVSDFVWINENCFSVDISFIKHMVLRIGTAVDDPMNDRFYFVKYDDPEDAVDGPVWKLAGMKEIVDNEK